VKVVINNCSLMNHLSQK